MRRPAMGKGSTDAAPEGCVFHQLKPRKLASVLTEIPQISPPATATAQHRFGPRIRDAAGSGFAETQDELG